MWKGVVMKYEAFATAQSLYESITDLEAQIDLIEKHEVYFVSVRIKDAVLDLLKRDLADYKEAFEKL